MNNAGLPGTGLGGLFYVLLALAMPVVELHRTLQGRSSRARWALVLRQLGTALGVVGAVLLTGAAVSHLGLVPAALPGTGVLVVAVPALLSVGVLAVLVVALRLWAWATSGRPPHPLPPALAPGPGKHRTPAP
ncbi:hypothetical protein H5V45_00225 [Nocardioides sp. KIGAM211]|uniref:Uncharacterized protein n=1 Tax=Nocardioides luti TaxID=2761101 RepID=A0A7X0RCG2_9ACTN|nr:hypothetical protein [Nocardioides luti]MBB6625731.1 hypothetical protein [Nocardioides luti]